MAEQEVLAAIAKVDAKVDGLDGRLTKLDAKVGSFEFKRSAFVSAAVSVIVVVLDKVFK